MDLLPMAHKPGHRKFTSTHPVAQPPVTVSSHMIRLGLANKVSKGVSPCLEVLPRYCHVCRVSSQDHADSTASLALTLRLFST